MRSPQDPDPATAGDEPSEVVEPDDADIVAALRKAASDDRARLRAAVNAVRQARPPLVGWQGGGDADGVIHMQFPVYHPAVSELIAALGQAHATAVFDWMRWPAIDRYQHASDVVDAPLPDVVRLITTFVRGERFADGTIAAALDDGRLLAAAQRILDAW